MVFNCVWNNGLDFSTNLLRAILVLMNTIRETFDHVNDCKYILNCG